VGPSTLRINRTSDNAQLESMRMLTLRIQQTCHRSGSVVLFSSLDPTTSAAPTIASVAECLADREERVLLVDAVSPDRSLTPILNLFASGNAAAEPAGRIAVATEGTQSHVPVAPVGNPPGLGEYFLNECKATSDLIRPTNCPGVDLIASGSTAFHREALASSALTELLNTCRQKYTMILVHGPAATWAADLQMLAARADGVVLAASKRVGRDPQVREIVEDLMNLGAPIVGVVA
jgi:Mrp family chromosome partitioning ATPase